MALSFSMFKVSLSGGMSAFSMPLVKNSNPFALCVFRRKPSAVPMALASRDTSTILSVQYSLAAPGPSQVTGRQC